MIDLIAVKEQNSDIWIEDQQDRSRSMTLFASRPYMAKQLHTCWLELVTVHPNE